jgi:transposase InsO family protein
MDFVCTRTRDGRWLRTLRVVDIFTREALALVVDRSLTGVKVATALSRILEQRPKPQAISGDNGTEFVSKAMDGWADGHDVRLDFIRAGRPVENAFIESFNGPLRDECLNSHVFGTSPRRRPCWTSGATTTIEFGPIARCRTERPWKGQYVTESRETRDSVRSMNSDWKPAPQPAQSPFRCSGFPGRVTTRRTLFYAGRIRRAGRRVGCPHQTVTCGYLAQRVSVVAGSQSPDSLLKTKRVQRVESKRAAGRQPAREKDDAQQERGRSAEHDWITRADAVQERSDHSAADECRRETCRDPY